MSIEGLTESEEHEIIFNNGAKFKISVSQVVAKPRQTEPDEVFDPFEAEAGEYICLLGDLERAEPTSLKVSLLHKYSGREPKRFAQYDGFANCDPRDDDILRPDADGDSICGGDTTELMIGATVRVLVEPGTDPETARRILQKIGDWILDMPTAPLRLDDFTPGDSFEQK